MRMQKQLLYIDDAYFPLGEKLGPPWDTDLQIGTTKANMKPRMVILEPLLLQRNHPRCHK
jgi:hypothetical protein